MVAIVGVLLNRKLLQPKYFAVLKAKILYQYKTLTYKVYTVSKNTSAIGKKLKEMKTHELVLDKCIYASPEISSDLFTSIIAKP